MGEAERLEGLGGWLILIGFLVVVGPILTLISLIGLWDEGSRGASQSGVFWFAIAVQLTLLLVQLYIMYLFFTKNHKFPRVFCVILIINLIIMIVLGLAAGNSSWTPLIAIISSILQLSYILNSERVKLTFTR
jgi:hypothetical protein